MELIGQILLTALCVVIGIMMSIGAFGLFVMLNNKEGTRSPLARLGVCVLAVIVGVGLFSLFLSWAIILISCIVTTLIILLGMLCRCGQPTPDPIEEEDRDFY